MPSSSLGDSDAIEQVVYDEHQTENRLTYVQGLFDDAEVYPRIHASALDDLQSGPEYFVETSKGEHYHIALVDEDESLSHVATLITEETQELSDAFLESKVIQEKNTTKRGE